MDSTAILHEALHYEEKIRNLYQDAERQIDDPRGKAIFAALAVDEQSHIDFLHYVLNQLAIQGVIDLGRLVSPLPRPEQFEARLAAIQHAIPQRMLGDIKSILSSALQLEKETSAFYSRAVATTSGAIKMMMEKFVEIENRHTELVRIELDHASGLGTWFDFMEVSMELE